MSIPGSGAPDEVRAAAGRPSEPLFDNSSGVVQAQTAQESLSAAFGGKSGLLDTGLPGVVFVLAYTVSGRDMRLAVILALVTGALLAVIRIVRKERLQNAIAGLAGVAVAAYIAGKTGEARNFFLPGILINIGYGAAYAISVLVRWPLIGVLVAAVQGHGMGWRRDPVQLRVYSRATWLWVGMFALRLAVQVPLYLAGDRALVAIGIARLAMGWPLFLLTAWLTYLVVRNAPAMKPAATPASAGESGETAPVAPVALAEPLTTSSGDADPDSDPQARPAPSSF